MIYPRRIEIRARGYDDFIDRVLPKLDEICDQTINDPEGHLQIAVMEAANNVARYSPDGLMTAEIILNITIHMCDLCIQIRGETRAWDVESFVDYIKALAYSEEWQNKDFGEFKKDRLSGRGIWLMLEACEYLYIDKNTKAITMAVSYPFKQELITQKMNILADRLHILRNGVVT